MGDFLGASPLGASSVYTHTPHPNMHEATMFSAGNALFDQQGLHNDRGMDHYAPSAIREESSAFPGKPGGHVGTGLPGAVKVVSRFFLNGEHLRKLHRILSEVWSNAHALSAAVRLMETHGVKLTEQEEQTFLQMPEDRMIDALVMRMPQQSREQFEHFFLQLSLIASTTSRLRQALEKGETDVINEALESAENVGILSYILKMAVAQAGGEVRNKEVDHHDWLMMVCQKMRPLLQASADATEASTMLAQVRAELKATRIDASEKSKSVLMTMVAGRNESLLASTFLSWNSAAKRLRLERQISADFKDEIDRATEKLADFKTTQLLQFKSVMMKTIEACEMSVLYKCFNALRGEMEERREAKALDDKLRTLEGKMKELDATTTASVRQVLTRITSGTSHGQSKIAFQAWVAFLEDTKAHKQRLAEVQVQRARMNAFLAKQAAGAHQVLGCITAEIGRGLLCQCIRGWAKVITMDKRAEEMEVVLSQKRGQFATQATRNKATGRKELERMAMMSEQGLCHLAIAYWRRETKIERVRRYGQEKNAKRKAQLAGVKGLFKNFADELEDGLKKGTPRVEGIGRRRGRSDRSRRVSRSPSPSPGEVEQ